MENFECSQGIFRRSLSAADDDLRLISAGLAPSELVVLYDGRPKPLPVRAEMFEQTRKRAYETWNDPPKKSGDTFASEIRQMQEEYMQRAAIT